MKEYNVKNAWWWWWGLWWWWWWDKAARFIEGQIQPTQTSQTRHTLLLLIAKSTPPSPQALRGARSSCADASPPVAVKKSPRFSQQKVLRETKSVIWQTRNKRQKEDSLSVGLRIEVHTYLHWFVIAGSQRRNWLTSFTETSVGLLTTRSAKKSGRMRFKDCCQFVVKVAFWNVWSQYTNPCFCFVFLLVGSQFILLAGHFSADWENCSQKVIQWCGFKPSLYVISQYGKLAQLLCGGVT